MVKHCHFNMMYFRTTCVFFGMMSWACFGIYGVDGTPTVILVNAGSDVVLECVGEVSKRGTWYKTGNKQYVAYIYVGTGTLCKMTKYEYTPLPGLSLGDEDCTKHALKISNISNVHKGVWKCKIGTSERSIHVHLAPPAEHTTVNTRSMSSFTTPKVTPTSTSLKVTSTLTAPGSTTYKTNDPTTSVTDTSSTGYKNESRTKDSTNPQTPPVNSMLPLLGGTIGGALVLLAAVITVCCLLRSRKQRHTDGSAERPVKGHPRNQDPEQGEDAVMVGNPIYSSYDGDVDYAQIGGARQTASTKAGTVACDVYSVVQKHPKSEGQGMSHQPTDKDAEMSELYSQVQKPQRHG
ncbi:uncharacterized protein [Haliotis cracherodii]|uniref:uncharacterized protein n=1 Tax=Haliotis cracherodii TaxID=6455 RepID=UPI0039EAF88B